MESSASRTVLGRYGDALGLSGRVRGPLGHHPYLTPGVGYALTVLYAVFEYGRPQDAVPLVSALRVSLVSSACLAVVTANHVRNVPWFRPQVLLLTALLAMMAAWVPFATNNYWAMKAVMVVGQTFVFVLAFATFVDTEERLRRFVLIWLGAGLFQASWGIANGGSGTGYFQADENDFALTMCMILPFAWMTMDAIRHRGQRILCAVTGLMCLIGVVASDSRGGFVGLVVTSAMMVLMHRRRARLMVVGAVTAAGLVVMAPATYWDEIRTIFDEGGTRADRIRLWEIAGDVFRDNPVLGIGPNNINWVINEYQDLQPDERMHGGRAVHSLYYTLLPEMGAVGGLLWFGILLYNGRDLRRVMRTPGGDDAPPIDPYARAIACSITAYLVCGVFLSVLWYPHFYFLTAMALSARSIQERRDWEPAERTPTDPQPEAALEGAA